MGRRSPESSIAIFLLLTLIVAPLSGQLRADANPLSACFRVAIAETPAEATLALPEAEIVEFVFEPSHAWATGYERTWRLTESGSTETVAFWWPEDDGLVAIWTDDDHDRMLTLRLVSSGRGLTGTAYPTLRPGDERLRVEALPIRCSAESG